MVPPTRWRWDLKKKNLSTVLFRLWLLQHPHMGGWNLEKRKTTNGRINSGDEFGSSSVILSSFKNNKNPLRFLKKRKIWNRIYGCQSVSNAIHWKWQNNSTLLSVISDELISTWTKKNVVREVSWVQVLPVEMRVIQRRYPPKRWIVDVSFLSCWLSSILPNYSKVFYYYIVHSSFFLGGGGKCVCVSLLLADGPKSLSVGNNIAERRRRRRLVRRRGEQPW
jgi:hypothetical protein